MFEPLPQKNAALTFTSHSLEETFCVAKDLFKKLPQESVLCFFGDLGSGKTTFIKALAEAAGIDQEQVTSPTYVYLNIYSGSNAPFYHFDLYRLKDEEAFFALGFDEFLFAPGIKCLEWSERIEKILPPDIIKITLVNQGESQREIRVEGL